MKLVKYNEGRLGALMDDESVIDLNYAYVAYKHSKGAANPQRKADAKVPSCLLAFIKEGDVGLDEAKKAIEYAKAVVCCGPKGEKLVYKKGEYKLRAPLPSPGNKIAMAGANFYDHSIDAYKMLRGDTTTLEELKAQVEKGEYRTWGFWKQSSFVRDPDGKTPYPARTHRMDYEVELAAVLGKYAKDTKEAEGMSYIYGYTIVNDLSIRDGGMGSGPDGFFFAKNFDGSAPMGPCIVTKDEIKDPYKLAMKQWVNSELRQNGSMSSIIRGYEWWLEWLSKDVAFYPGDMICGGTCSGTAMDQTPRVDGKTDPKLFLKPGDELKAWIEGVGTLKTKIVPKE
ncbi:fumarylacetoacetate hydrolase family protein [Candidatus Bathyarchaeota archaeon]|nr:fumarylacetoacetate hydrolase family protein [Candidatus Bathyarchaeota archaeon]